MGLTKNMQKNLNIKDIKRVEYYDSRYYKITYMEGKKQKMTYLPSVTEILSAMPNDFLARWRGDVGNERADQISSDALKLGSFVHYCAEILAKGGLVIYNPISNPIYTDAQVNAMKKKYKDNFAIVRFQKEWLQVWRIAQFFEVLKPFYIETEQTVYSIKHGFAGTLDLIIGVEEGEYLIAGSKPLWLERGYYICDYKTSKAVSINYKMQIAAYTHAVIEGLSDKDKMKKEIRGGLILHTNAEAVKNGIQGFKAHLVNYQETLTYLEHFLNVQKVYKINKPTPEPEEFLMPTVLTLDSKSKK